MARERQQFRVGRDLGEQAGSLDAPQIDEHHAPDGGEREHHHHDPIVQRWEEIDYGAGKRDRDHRQRRPDRYPIAPGDQKAHEVAIGNAGVGVRAARRRRQSSEPCKDEAEAHRAGTHDDPGDDRQVAVGGNRRRREIEAGADHVADDDCGTRRKAETFLPVSRRAHLSPQAPCEPPVTWIGSGCRSPLPAIPHAHSIADTSDVMVVPAVPCEDRLQILQRPDRSAFAGRLREMAGGVDFGAHRSGRKAVVAHGLAGLPAETPWRTACPNRGRPRRRRSP